MFLTIKKTDDSSTAQLFLNDSVALSIFIDIIHPEDARLVNQNVLSLEAEAIKKATDELVEWFENMKDKHTGELIYNRRQLNLEMIIAFQAHEGLLYGRK